MEDQELVLSPPPPGTGNIRSNPISHQDFSSAPNSKFSLYLRVMKLDVLVIRSAEQQLSVPSVFQ